MRLIDFFDSRKIIRDNDFLVPYSQYFVGGNCIAYVANLESLEKINNNENISAVITTQEFGDLVSRDKGIVISSNPKEDYFKLHNNIALNCRFKLVEKHFIHKSAKIAPTAIVGRNVQIGANVQISDYAIIKNNSIIGDYTRIESNVIIGGDGMQTSYFENKNFFIEHLGGVKIGSYCHIYEGAIVQKPYQGYFTELGNYSQISVFVNVGHGTKIGENCVIAGSAQISGNCKIGNNVWIGPSATIADNLKIGDNAKIRIGTIVIKNVMDSEDVSGNFAINHNSNLKNYINRWRRSTI